MPSRPRSRPLPLPPWTAVPLDDPRDRPGAVEGDRYVCGQWARRVRAASNRAWTNAAKVIALIVDQRPDARYVEGWAHMYISPVWHAWIDVPLDTAGRSWLRIDPSPMWNHFVTRNHYWPVIEATAHDMAPLVAPLSAPRGRARCALPLVTLEVRPFNLQNQPKPEQGALAALGPDVVSRAEAGHAFLEEKHEARLRDVYADGRAELDRLAAMRVLPSEE